MPPPIVVDGETCAHCYLDFDLDRRRERLSTAAAFVHACDARYGLSSRDLLRLGGSELNRIPEQIEHDHEWSERGRACGSVRMRHPDGYGSRIVVRLYWDVAPLACENFATLCLNGGSLPSDLLGASGGGGAGGGARTKVRPTPMGESGRPLTYRGTPVHRIVPGFVAQGGDLVFGNGSGGESVYGGKKFKDERAGLALKHDRRGLLSMGNGGKNSNTSQFFFTLDRAPQCDGKHVVFGEVVSGFAVLDALEEAGTEGGEPSIPANVTDCAIFGPLQTPGDGYWYDQPDPEAYRGSTPVFVVRPRVCVVAPNAAVGDRFVTALRGRCSVIAKIFTDDGAKEGIDRIAELLGRFATDVVLVAPTCAGLLDNRLEISPSWKECKSLIGAEIRISEVILVAKPVEAVATIRIKSWVAKRRPDWRLA